MRKDIIKKCIESAIFLSQNCDNEITKNTILQRAELMLNDIWKFEYKQIKQKSNNIEEYKRLLLKDFWEQIHTEMECEQLCYKFQAIFDETINPPQQEGNVEIFVHPNRSVEMFVFKLKGI